MNYKKHYDQLIKTRQLLNRQKVLYDGLEKHHIIPKSLGGGNSKQNLILLTPREHFIAHMLLVKIHVGKNRAKMAYALLKMSQSNSSQQRTTTSQQFEMMRNKCSEVCSGVNHPLFGRKLSEEQRKQISEKMKGELNHRFGTIAWNRGLNSDNDDRLKQKKERWLKNYELGLYDHVYKNRPRHTEETKQKISNSHKHKQKTEEHKRKISETLKGRPRDPNITKKQQETRLKNKTNEKLPHFKCPHCDKEGKGNSMLRWHFDNCRSKIPPDDQLN